MGKVFLWKYAVILLCVGGIAYGHHHHHHHHPHHPHHHEHPDEYDLPHEVPTHGYKYVVPKVEVKSFSGIKSIQRISDSRSTASFGKYEDEYEPPMPPPVQYSRNEYRSQREPVQTYAPPPRSRTYIADLPPVRSNCESCSECQEEDEYYSCPCARERGGSYNAEREVSYRPHVQVEQCPCACGDNSFMDCPCCSGGDCPYCSEGNCPCGGSCPSQDVEDNGDCPCFQKHGTTYTEECPCCQRHGATYTEECPCNCANEPESYIPRGRGHSTYQEFSPVRHVSERRGGYAPVPQMEDSDDMYAPLPPPPPPPAYTQIQQPPVGQFRSVPMDDIPEVRRIVTQRPPMEVPMPPYEPPQPQRIQIQPPQSFIMKGQPELSLPPVGSRVISPEEPAPPQVLQSVPLSSNVPMPPPVIRTMRIPGEGNMQLPPVIQTVRVPTEVAMSPQTNQPVQQIQQLPPQYVTLDQNFPQNVQYGRPVMKGIPNGDRKSYMTPIVNTRMKPTFLEGLSFSEGC